MDERTKNLLCHGVLLTNREMGSWSGVLGAFLAVLVMFGAIALLGTCAK